MKTMSKWVLVCRGRRAHPSASLLLQGAEAGGKSHFSCRCLGTNTGAVQQALSKELLHEDVGDMDLVNL